MSYHDFEAGVDYPMDEIVERLEEINRPGRIIKLEEKAAHIDRIAASGKARAVFQPFAQRGWGASPLNPRTWRTLDGEKLCPED